MLRAVTLQPHPRFFCNNFHRGERTHPPAYTGESIYNPRWSVCPPLGKTLQDEGGLYGSPKQGNGVRRTVEKAEAKSVVDTDKYLALHFIFLLYVVAVVESLLYATVFR
jgi:hypothetical protein